MTRYWFDFTTVMRYDRAVSGRVFSLRCTPMADCGQMLECHDIDVVDASGISSHADGMGVVHHLGCIEPPHTCFIFSSRGVVACAGPYRPQPSACDPVYAVSTALTAPTQEMVALARRIMEGGGTPAHLMEAVAAHMAYTPGVTTSLTDAATAWQLGLGVCQDYAHVMLSMCRCCGLRARYVSGFLAGEGATHAWVEVWHDGEWHGLDPTHACRVEHGYVKLAHGRDARDCDVARGVYRGVAQESIEARVRMEKL